MILKGTKIGWALTGSSCNFENVFPEIERLANKGADLYPIVSDAVNFYDTRFGTAELWKSKFRNITGKELITNIVEAEPIGPKLNLDILIVAPCTGNTLAKLAHSITDTSVTMACKAQLRNERPLVLAIATNDGLRGNAKNLGLLLNMKNIFFVPFGQDNPIKKPNSLVAKFKEIEPTLNEALLKRQMQPILV